MNPKIDIPTALAIVYCRIYLSLVNSRNFNDGSSLKMNMYICSLDRKIHVHEFPTSSQSTIEDKFLEKRKYSRKPICKNGL